MPNIHFLILLNFTIFAVCTTSNYDQQGTCQRSQILHWKDSTSRQDVQIIPGDTLVQKVSLTFILQEPQSAMQAIDDALLLNSTHHDTSKVR